MKKNILFIDTTLTAKSKYIVPTMTPTKCYITTFDGIDIAIGFENMQAIKDYMGVSKELDYDYVLVDLDNPINYKNFEFSPDDEHFLVTSFDVYSVQKGIEVLREIPLMTEMTKVLFTRDPNSEEKEYIDFITLNCKVKWKEDIVYFPFETEDLYAIFENQRFSKIKFANLGYDYLDALSYFLEKLSDSSKGDIKRAIKAVDR